MLDVGCWLVSVRNVDTAAGQRGGLRRGRPGLTGKTRRTFRRGYPAANSLSRIFVRIGCRLDGLPFTIPDSMPGSLDFYCLGIATPWLFRRDHLREAVTTHAVNGRRNSSTTVMRRILARI